MSSALKKFDFSQAFIRNSGRGATALFSCFCGIFPCTISATFFGLYFTMLQRSLFFQEHMTDKLNSLDHELPEIGFYNSCGHFINADHKNFTTDWTIIFAVNSILYMVLTVFTLMLCLTFLAWPIGMVGIFGHIIFFVGHLGTLIITGMLRYSAEGEKCAMSRLTVPYNNEGDRISYLNDGQMIEDLFIAACVLFLAYNCCIFQMSWVANAAIWLEKNGGKKED